MEGYIKSKTANETKISPSVKLNQNKIIQELEEEIDRLSLEIKKKHQEKRLVEEKYLNNEESFQRTIMERES